MKCDLCDAEATVHETQIVNGQVMVRRLCERHAAEVGLTGHASVSVPAGSASVVLSVQQQGSGLKCGNCGLSFAAFRQHGLLGCPTCYEAFEDKLSPLIERAHQGGTHHIGKTPKRMLAAAREGDQAAIERVLGGARERAERVALLRKQLEEAIAMEQYERAAALRDELRRLEAEASSETGGPGPSGGSGEAAGDAE
ncbi:hypothetical protein AY599_11195 [Leptolyngbya valderiana BDU 20041]|nr:hypothetical protein AY599_11195 [Leptolyngbya valderiana BDU 20041]